MLLFFLSFIKVYHDMFTCTEILNFHAVKFIFFLVTGFHRLLKKSFLSSGHEDSLQYCLLVLNYPIWQPLVAI